MNTIATFNLWMITCVQNTFILMITSWHFLGTRTYYYQYFSSKRYSWNRVGCSTYARLDYFFVTKKALYYIKDEGSTLGENMMKYSWRTKSVFENDTIFDIRPENRFKIHYDKTWKKQLVQFNYMTIKWNKWLVQFSYIVICSSHE